MVKVTLDEKEVQFCKDDAYKTHLKAKTLGKGHGDPTQDTWDKCRHKEYLGKLGECAVAKLTKHTWNDMTDFGKVGDVGKVQARATHYRGGRLFVYDTDLDNQVLVLVTLDVGKEDFKLNIYHYSIACRVVGHAKQPASFYRDDAHLTPKEFCNGETRWWIEQSELEKFDKLSQLQNLVTFGFDWRDGHGNETQVQNELFRSAEGV